MSAEAVRRAIDALGVGIDEIREVITFVSTATSIRPHLGSILRWEAMDAGAKQLAQQFMRAREARLDGVFRGLFVGIASAYEQYVRDLVVAGVELAHSRAKAFDDLQDGLRNQHTYWTGRAMETVFTRRAHVRYDYYALAGNIGTCVPGSREFRMNAEAFAADINTPNAEALERALDRLAIKAFWDDLGRRSDVQRALGTANVRETSNAVQTYLDEFVVKRNAVVHGRGAAVSIVEADVVQAADVVRAVADALGAVVVQRLS